MELKLLNHRTDKVQTVEVINSFAASAISGCSAKRNTGARGEVSINNNKREFARDRQFHNLIKKQRNHIGVGNNFLTFS